MLYGGGWLGGAILLPVAQKVVVLACYQPGHPFVALLSWRLPSSLRFMLAGLQLRPDLAACTAGFLRSACEMHAKRMVGLSMVHM